MKPKSIPAAKVLPELANDVLRIAAMLRGARHKAGITQAQLSKISGIRRQILSEIETGKRPLDKQTAKQLAMALNCDFCLFL